MIDVSIILNIHREQSYLRRTFLSIESAVRYAAMDGISCEIIIVADRSDPGTLAWIRAQDYGFLARVTIVEVDNGSLGLSRNDGLREAVGEFVLMADADDLVSINTVSASVAAARASTGRAIHFPQWYLAFGNDPHLYEMQPLSVIGVEAMVGAHPFVSRFLARRSDIEDLRFHDLRVTSGFAFEDWHFNLEAAAAGLELNVVPDVTVYYRQRQDSLLRAANRLSIGTTDWSRFLLPDVYLTLIDGQSPRRVDDRRLVNRESIQRRFLGSQLQVEMMLTAAGIDPAINPVWVEHVHAFSNAGIDPRPGEAWARICRLIGDQRFDEVLLVPFLSHGGGEKYILNVMDSILRQYPDKRLLILSGQPFGAQAPVERRDATFVDLQHMLGFDDPGIIDILALRAIQTFAPKSRLHIKTSPFCIRFLRRFAPVLPHQIIYYRFCDNYRNWHGQLTRLGDEFDFLSDMGANLTQIVCDNDHVHHADIYRLDHLAERYATLYNWVEPDLDGRAGGAPQRILWASRLDFQKRPDLVEMIAARLSQKLPEVQIDLWGSSMLDGPAQSVLSRLEAAPNVNLRGPFAGFGSLPLEDYGIFLYTACFDGLPNVVLEAMRAGFPVIAPVLGGIGEVLTEATGYPLPGSLSDAELADAYVAAIEEALQDSGARQQKAAAAAEHVSTIHGLEQYDRNVAALFTPT